MVFFYRDSVMLNVVSISQMSLAKSLRGILHFV